MAVFTQSSEHGRAPAGQCQVSYVAVTDDGQDEIFKTT